MDQVKIGKYIAEKRRSKNMTQKSLAEQLMVSVLEPSIFNHTELN